MWISFRYIYTVSVSTNVQICVRFVNEINNGHTVLNEAEAVL